MLNQLSNLIILPKLRRILGALVPLVAMKLCHCYLVISLCFPFNLQRNILSWWEVRFWLPALARGTLQRRVKTQNAIMPMKKRSVAHDLQLM
jgi:hypothetical protein